MRGLVCSPGCDFRLLLGILANGGSGVVRRKGFRMLLGLMAAEGHSLLSWLGCRLLLGLLTDVGTLCPDGFADNFWGIYWFGRLSW